MTFPDSCVSTFKDKLLVFGEKRSKVIFNNASLQPLKRIVIDNCVIKEGIRCDFLVLEHDQSEHFIELKGSDVEHAAKQLAATIRQCTSSRSTSKSSYIVTFRNPLSATENQILKVKFKKEMQSKLIISSSPLTINL